MPPADELHVVRHHPDTRGLPVVLVHGAPDRSRNFTEVVRRFDDLPVTVYDRRGYGRSTGGDGEGAGPGGFDVHAGDLIDLLGGRPAVVCGQSAGGAIALLAAATAPELFLAVGVWEPPLVSWEWWVDGAARDETMAWGSYEDPRQLGEDFNRWILGDDRWEQLPETTKEMLRAEGRAFRADLAYQSEVFVDLDQIRVPVVVGHGTVSPDPRFLDAHRRLAERLGAERFEGEGADHFAHLGHPDVWARFVRRAVEVARRAARHG